MRVIFHSEADQELTEATAWYEERSQLAAQAFALEIDHAIRARASAAAMAAGQEGRAPFRSRSLPIHGPVS